MESQIISLIEDSIYNKNDNLDMDISSKLNISIPQSILIIKYIKKFCILSSLLDSKYMNYFNEIDLFDLKEKDEITDDNFAKAIILFIKGKQSNKKFYFVKIMSENDIKLHVLVLKQLNYQDYEYDVKYDLKINSYLINNLEIFKYIYNIFDEYEFHSLSDELIEKNIDSPLIPYFSLNDSNLDKLIEYSEKYPNRIRYIDSYGITNLEKLKILIELNKNSLKVYPHCKFKYLIPLPNATIFNIFNLDLKDFNEQNYDFSKIKKVRIDNTNSEPEDYINILNKFKNLEEIEFFEICSESLYAIIENIKCKKVKKISGICEDLEDEYNYEKLFKNLPLLEKFLIEEHQTMNWTYEISPIFLAERKRLSYPLLEQLIRNYLKGSNDRDISLQFDDEFDQFWAYFKDKKDIISRVSKLYGTGVFFSLDSYFKCSVNEYNKIDQIPNANYKYFYVEQPFDKQILDFITKNKIENLFIKGGGNIDLNELIKCENIQFIFDNSSKKFCYKINGAFVNI